MHTIYMEVNYIEGKGSVCLLSRQTCSRLHSLRSYAFSAE